jgi:hypothetical protein
MRGFRNGDRGQAGIALIIVIAWALSAVLILTRTLVAAQEINSKVTVITAKLAGSKGDTSYVGELNTIDPTAQQILAAAQPLTGQIAIIDATAKHIDQQVDGITPPVQTINQVVHVIHDQVGAILATASTINATLTTVRNTQSSVILTDVKAIKADTTSIITNVHTIDSNLCHANHDLSAAGLLKLGSVLSSGGDSDVNCVNGEIHPPA